MAKKKTKKKAQKRRTRKKKRIADPIEKPSQFTDEVTEELMSFTKRQLVEKMREQVFIASNAKTALAQERITSGRVALEKAAERIRHQDHKIKELEERVESLLERNFFLERSGKTKWVIIDKLAQRVEQIDGVA